MSRNRNSVLPVGNSAADEESLIRSRRAFLKGIACGAVTALVVPALSGRIAHAAETGGNRVLIVYFSHSGNTRQLAEQIHARVGGDMVELKTVNPYPQSYKAVVDVAQEEQRSNARPRIATQLDNLDAYETVFIGFPNWWGTLPMPFFTLLETYDLGRKTVVPFCTHEGSRFGRSESDLKRLCPQARLLKGFEVRGSRVADAQKDVDEWLRGLGMGGGR